VLLHHLLGEANGIRGAWGHAIGGMGAITQAMAKACAAKGVDIRLDAEVAEVLVEKGRAVGVVCDNGETIRARAVISNLNPKLLFQKLVDPAHLPQDFRSRIDSYRVGSGTFRMNVALSELPRFSCLPGAGDHMTAGIIIAPSLAYMDRAFTDARARGWSENPVVEMLVPSTLDDTLAPSSTMRRLWARRSVPT
jgi:phytoene dehydrogenase-like protein